MANDKTNASDKIAEFQKQAREVLRAQQEAYLSAVKTWREGLAKGAQPPPWPSQRACRHAAASERSGGGILRIRREVARRPEPFHGRVEQGDRSAPEEGLKSSSVQNPGRPWLELYRDVPAAIEPPSRTALDMFRATAVGGRDRVLIRYFDRPITVDQCDVMSDALAVALQKRGVESGDRIAVYMQNVPQVLISVLAAWKCGAVVVPCNPMLRERELVKVLSGSGCRVLLCQEDLYADVARAALPSTAVQHAITTSPLEFLDPASALPKVLAGITRSRDEQAADLFELVERHAGESPAPVELTGDDVAFMVYTSGTTGDPKGAMNTHRNVVFATSVYERWIGLTRDDTILGLAPLFHVTGLIGHVTLAMLTGSPLVLFYRFDVDEACRLTAVHRATFTVSAVTAFIALLNSEAMANHDLSSLTKVYTGGAPTPPTVLDDWHGRTGVRIQPMYGLTEATSPTHMTPHGSIPPVDPHTGAMSVGIPVFNTHVKVVTDSGHEAAPREIGEFVIAGPQIVPGYWQKPAETAKALGQDGLRTGDVGFMDELGWFYLVDRSKDMIVASGFKVWPREVEEVLYQHPAVREAAVVGIPDPYRGETIKAVISLKPGQTATEDEIRAFARERMAAYKYPRVVEIIDELPKTTSGKIMRRLLQPTTRVAAVPVDAELGDVSYPQLRAAVEARAVLEAGATWLRLSRERFRCRPRPRSTNACASCSPRSVRAASSSTAPRCSTPTRRTTRRSSISPRTSICRSGSAACGCASSIPWR